MGNKEKYSSGIAKLAMLTVFSAILLFLTFITVIFIGMKVTGNSLGHDLILAGQPIALSEGSSLYWHLSICDRILRALFFLPLFAMAIFAAVLFVIMKKYKFGQKKIPCACNRIAILALCLFIFPIITIFIIGSYIESSVRKEVLAAIENLSPEAQVLVNGKEVDNDQLIIKELAQTKPMPAHHTHSINEISVEIKDKKQGVVLILGRDSSVDDEYWVFYPGYNVTYSNEIGRIRTSIFANY